MLIYKYTKSIFSKKELKKEISWMILLNYLYESGSFI